MLARDTLRAHTDAQLARQLLTWATDLPYAWWLARPDEALSADAQQRFSDALRRLQAGEPLAYIVGSTPFWTFDLQVSPAVLIPRADTETLVRVALKLAASIESPKIADLGTGSGAIALALAAERPDAQVFGLDASQAALATARANAQRLGSRVQWLRSDWCTALKRDSIELLVSNPPYIAEHDSHLPALRYEPTIALVSGRDGLQAIRAIIADAPRVLKPGGWLAFEHGYEQAQAVASLLSDAGFHAIALHRDLAGRPRVTVGQLATTSPPFKVAASI